MFHGAAAVVLAAGLALAGCGGAASSSPAVAGFNLRFHTIARAVMIPVIGL